MEIETDSRCRLSRWRGRTLRAVVFLLLVGGISHMIGCNGLFYYPSARQYSKPADLAVPVEEVEFKSADGTALYGWLLRPPGEREALGTVVHFHGNAQNMTSHVQFVDWLAERGYNVFVFDYRGYGRSGGRAKRSGIIADSQAALDYIRGRKDIDSSRLLVLGQSLGGACALAALGEGSTEGVQAIAIDSSFLSYRQVANSVLGGTVLTKPLVHLLISPGHDPADTIAKLEGIPLLFIHGDRDRIVPISNGQALFEAAPEPKKFLRVPGARHMHALEGDTKDELVKFFAESLAD